ncbi:MAG TPA: cytidine deaminase [Bacillota bacterium]|nr:cytidine deaminase [Bacillota bacterium]
MMKETLIKQAVDIRKRAYVPYSKFAVGAAVRTHSGRIYTGCNIENASYPLACCAERVAIFKAVSAGETEFLDMAIVADIQRPIPPCGSCRQVMNEFFAKSTPIYLANLQHDIKTVTVEELLPFSFQSSDLR